MRRGARGGLVAPGLTAALTLAACGSLSLTPAQVRSRAARVCVNAANRLDAIHAPTATSGAQAFLRRGIAVLEPEVRELRALHSRGPVAAAVHAIDGELAALHGTLSGLRAGNDPVVAIKTLQPQLAPLELRVNAAWRALRLPACVSR